MRLLPILPAAFAIVLSTAGAREVDACINGYIMETDDAIRQIARAEKAFAKGKYRRVLALLHAEHYSVERRLLRRIQLLQASARVRLGKTRGPERVLRRLLRRKPDSPVLQARLGEALHRRRGGEAVEALEILGQLEQADLMPDANGYAALAYLRRRTGDLEGHARALARCRAMTSSKTLCWTP
jgi:hypothetical protein